MDADIRQKLEALFEYSIQTDSGSRERLYENIREENQELACELRSLVEHSERADASGFLSDPWGGQAWHPTSSRQANNVLKTFTGVLTSAAAHGS